MASGARCGAVLESFGVGGAADRHTDRVNGKENTDGEVHLCAEIKKFNTEKINDGKETFKFYATKPAV